MFRPDPGKPLDVLTRTKTTTILLVEGVRLHLEPERTFLRRRDVRLLTSGQGPELLPLARDRRPDLAVLDLTAPDGLALCRALKDDPATRRMPIVAVVSREGAPEAEAAGADAVVFEPIRQSEMLEAVRRFVRFPERKHPRCAANLRFTFAHADEVGQAFCRDLSPAGTFLKTDWAPEAGAELRLRFRLPGDEHEIGCRGIVRSVGGGGPPEGFGVEFHDIEPSDRERLEDFIRGQLR